MNDDTLHSALINDRQRRLHRDASASRLAHGSGEQRRWWRRVPTTEARTTPEHIPPAR